MSGEKKVVPTEAEFAHAGELMDDLFEYCERKGIPMMGALSSGYEERPGGLSIPIRATLCVGKASDVPFHPAFIVALHILKEMDPLTAVGVARTMDLMAARKGHVTHRSPAGTMDDEEINEELDGILRRLAGKTQEKE